MLHVLQLTTGCARVQLEFQCKILDWNLRLDFGRWTALWTIIYRFSGRINVAREEKDSREARPEVKLRLTHPGLCLLHYAN